MIPTREQILKGSRGTKTEDVSCPELGEGVVLRIRSLTAAGRGVFIKQSAQLKEQNKSESETAGDMERLIVILTAIDEEGNPLFAAGDMAVLGEFNADIISRCAEVGMRISGMTAKAAEDAAKNSEPAPSSGSTSA